MNTEGTKITVEQAGQKGGLKTKQRHGSKHYAEIRKKGHETILKRDPDFYKKLAASGLHAREVIKQEWIEANIAKNDSPTRKLANLLSGR